MIREGPKEKDGTKSGVKVFYVDKFDPRMPHPRKILSRNYHHIANNPVLSNLFPRENLVASCKRLPNLGEILSPTNQNTGTTGGGGGGGNPQPHDDGRVGAQGQQSGSSTVRRSYICLHNMFHNFRLAEKVPFL